MLFPDSRSRSEDKSSPTQTNSFPEMGHVQSDFDGERYEGSNEEALVEIANKAAERHIALDGLYHELSQEEQSGPSPEQRDWDRFAQSS